MKRIAIIGAGELGQQIAHLGLKNGYAIVGFFDDWANESTVMDLPVFGKLEDIDNKADCFDALVVGVGYKHFAFREQIFDTLHKKYDFATIIDKSDVIDPTAIIGDGCVLYPNVTIDKGVRVENNALLNISVTVGHDSVVGAHSFICGGALFAGRVNLGKCSFVGIHASLSDDIEIASNTIVGAHSLVLHPVNEEGGCYVGVPAQKITPKHGL